MRASIDKNRDMARSILPCKNREAARTAKTKTKRAARHAVRQELRAVAGLSDLDEWDSSSDLRREPTAEIRATVLRRRAGDKLNHFERWAIARTKTLRPEDRLTTMGALLPRGLIGEHALSHLRRRPELNPHPPYGYWRLHWQERQRLRSLAIQRQRHTMERAVRALVESLHGHRDLNRAMKSLTDRPGLGRLRPPHLLLETKDIETFVGVLYAARHLAPELNALHQLLRGGGGW